MALKRKSALSRNPLYSGASSSVDTTPFSIRFRDEKAKLNFFENFSQRGIHYECQVIMLDYSDTDLPTVIYSRGWGPLCDALVTCPSVLMQEFYSNMHGFNYSIPHFITSIQDTRIVVTSQIVADVLYVLIVEFPDYLGCERLRTASKDELIFAFYKHPSDWGKHQFTYCSGFAKGPQSLNMVMTFVLHPFSHYNSITEPRARFLISLIEGLTIDFPSHFILSIIDV